MPDPFGIGADVDFATSPDWRKEKEDEDPDDSQIETPSEVSLILGFDPAELESDENETEKQHKAETREKYRRTGEFEKFRVAYQKGPEIPPGGSGG